MALCMQRQCRPAAAMVGGRSAVLRRGLAPLMRCSAAPEKHEAMVQRLAMPVASVLTAAAVLTSVSLAAPGEALAARSGGRAGASSFSARRAAPRAAPASRMQNNYSSTTIVAAPPVYGYSPFGFGGFGFGGFMPVMPIPFFGGFLQLMFLMLIVSAVFNVIKGALGSGSSGSKKNQDWDDL